MQIAIADFETVAIHNRPLYPPKPVGIALQYPGFKKYLAWEHPTENNCTKKEACKYIQYVWNNYVVTFHNAAFDLEVAKIHFGVDYPKEWHDTLFLAYLNDPREQTLALKPLSEKYLNMPTKERDKVEIWLLENYYKPNKIKPTKKNPYGANYWRVPGNLIGKYAIGDIERTAKLFKFLYKKVKNRGMLGAYEREKLVLPIFEDMSKQGLPIRRRVLANDLGKYEKEYEDLEKKINRRLKTKNLDIASGEQLADAMDKANKVEHWVYTAPTSRFPTGQRSVKRENILKCCTDETLCMLLARHGLLGTMLNTFMRRWYADSEQEGRIFPSFNQVRTPDEHGKKSFGTRTGRPSSSNPNFFNIPKNISDRDKWAIGLPNIRNYIAPESGHILLNRDYAQQEIRIAAHFEDATLLQAYKQDPLYNSHAYAKEIIKELTGIDLPHLKVKIIAFGIIYGMGGMALAENLDVSRQVAKQLKNAYFAAFPGLKELNDEIILTVQKDLPIKTWGGRQYFVEPPKYFPPKGTLKGHWRDYSYKMLNYLIQGSAADCTKQAMINVYNAIDPPARIMLQVYDELLITAPKGKAKKVMQQIKEGMESVKFDVKMLTEGKYSPVSWGQMIKEPLR
jgi:DNA polymerase-1